MADALKVSDDAGDRFAPTLAALRQKIAMGVILNPLRFSIMMRLIGFQGFGIAIFFRPPRRSIS